MNEKLKERYETIKSLFDDENRKESFIKLMDYIENNTGYLNAPASNRYHLSIPEGLLIHSLNVAQEMLKIKRTLPCNISDASCIIVGLLHDLGKHDEYIENQPTPKQIAAGYKANPPYNFNEQETWLAHEGESIWILYELKDKFNFILTKEEFQAILYHNGPTVYPNMAFKNGDLMWIAHVADLLVTNVIETNESSKW